MLFLTRSVNVALRYGRRVWVSNALADTDMLPRLTVQDWLQGTPLPSGSFIISGNGGYDFPVDTLVLRHAHNCFRVMTAQALARADDGLAFLHEPNAPADRQWQAFLDEHHPGDAQRDQQALTA